MNFGQDVKYLSLAQGMFSRSITSGVRLTIKGMDKHEGKHMRTQYADALYVMKMSRMIEC